MARIVITVVAVAIFGVGVFAIWAWWSGDDDPPKLDTLQMLLTQRAVEEVATQLADKELPPGVDTLMMPVLTGTKGPEVAKLLEPALRERKWNLIEVGSFKRDHDSLSRWVETLFGNGAGDWFDQRWKDAGVHAFVRGSATFQDQDGHTKLLLAVRVEDSGTGMELRKVVSTQSIERSFFNLDYYRLTIDEWGTGWRILTWLLVLLLLPLACYPLAAAGLKKRRNSANLTLWLGFTAVDLFLAVALGGFHAPGFFGTVTLLLAMGLALFYNYGILTEIDDLR